MNKLALLFFILIALAGCYKNIDKVEKKWGPPAKVEERGDTLVYYWYFYTSQVKGSVVHAKKFSVLGPTSVTYGVVVIEIITDKTGKILEKRKYWKQPNS